MSLQCKQSDSVLAAKLMGRKQRSSSSLLMPDVHNPEASTCNLLRISSVIYFLMSKLTCLHCCLYYTGHTKFIHRQQFYSSFLQVSNPPTLWISLDVHSVFKFRIAFFCCSFLGRMTNSLTFMFYRASFEFYLLLEKVGNAFLLCQVKSQKHILNR